MPEVMHMRCTGIGGGGGAGEGGGEGGDEAGGEGAHGAGPAGRTTRGGTDVGTI
jgi:hypothetical protein